MFGHESRSRSSRAPAALAYWRDLESKRSFRKGKSYLNTPARSRNSGTVSDGFLEIGPLLQKVPIDELRPLTVSLEQRQITDAYHDGGERRESYRTPSQKNSFLARKRVSRSVSNDVLTNRSSGRNQWCITLSLERHNSSTGMPACASKSGAAVQGLLGECNFCDLGITDSVVASPSRDSPSPNDTRASHDMASRFVGSKDAPSVLLGRDVKCGTEGKSRRRSRINDILAISSCESGYASDQVLNGDEHVESQFGAGTMAMSQIRNADDGSSAGSSYDKNRFSAEAPVSTPCAVRTRTLLPVMPSASPHAHNQSDTKRMYHVDPRLSTLNWTRSLTVSFATDTKLSRNFSAPKTMPRPRILFRVENHGPFSTFLSRRDKRKVLHTSPIDALAPPAAALCADQASSSTLFPEPNADFPTLLLGNLEVPPRPSELYVPVLLPAGVDVGILDAEAWYRDEVEWISYIAEGKKTMRPRESFVWSCVDFLKMRRRQKRKLRNTERDMGFEWSRKNRDASRRLSHNGS